MPDAVRSRSSSSPPSPGWVCCRTALSGRSTRRAAGSARSLAHALDSGADEIVVGLGGSATTDGGAGTAHRARRPGARRRRARAAPGRRRAGPCRPARPVRSAPAGARRADRVRVRRGQPAARPDRRGHRLRPAEGRARLRRSLRLDAALARWAAVLALRDRPRRRGRPRRRRGRRRDVRRHGRPRRRTWRPGVETVLELVGFPGRWTAPSSSLPAKAGSTARRCTARHRPGWPGPRGRPGSRSWRWPGDCTLDDDELHAAGFAAVHTVLEVAPDLATALAEHTALLRRIGARSPRCPHRRPFR